MLKRFFFLLIYTLIPAVLIFIGSFILPEPTYAYSQAEICAQAAIAGKPISSDCEKCYIDPRDSYTQCGTASCHRAVYPGDYSSEYYIEWAYASCPQDNSTTTWFECDRIRTNSPACCTDPSTTQCGTNTQSRYGDPPSTCLIKGTYCDSGSYCNGSACIPNTPPAPPPPGGGGGIPPPNIGSCSGTSCGSLAIGESTCIGGAQYFCKKDGSECGGTGCNCLVSTGSSCGGSGCIPNGGSCAGKSDAACCGGDCWTGGGSICRTACNASCPDSSSVTCGQSISDGCGGNCGGSKGTYCAGNSVCISDVCVPPPAPPQQLCHDSGSGVTNDICNGETATSILRTNISAQNMGPADSRLPHMHRFTLLNSATGQTVTSPWNYLNNQGGIYTQSADGMTTLAEGVYYYWNTEGYSPSTGLQSSPSSWWSFRYVPIKPFIETKEGSVHSNQEIDLPGGPKP